MSGPVPVLTIDGPSGAGKGTVSRALASLLKWHYLDSGAIYRALAIHTLNNRVSLDDETRVMDMASTLDLEFCMKPEYSVHVAKQDVTREIQSEACGEAASKIAAYPRVREVLLGKQQEFRKTPGLVADGRDMGTVVFPDAPFKVFLTASAEIRAVRRHKQLKEKGMNVNLEQITNDIKCRDRRDMNRAAAPLAQAPDALFIDSSQLDVDQVIRRIHDSVCRRTSG